MKKMLQRGFTLIELLVVIAIIGILAAVVLASLNDARDGGRDASAKGSMNAVRSQMELGFNNGGFSYDGLCASADVQTLLLAVASSTGIAVGSVLEDPGANQAAGSVVCSDTASAWAASVQLNNDNYFCVDSTGAARETGNALPNGTVCP